MLTTLNTFLTTFIPRSEAASRPEHTLQLATAVLLIEVMRADGSTEEELANILNILKERFHLPDSEVKKLAELGQQTAMTAHDFHQFTSLINRELALPEKIRVIEYLWQVAYTDRHISAQENHLMRRLADLLHISHSDYIAAKMRVKPADME